MRRCNKAVNSLTISPHCWESTFTMFILWMSKILFGGFPARQPGSVTYLTGAPLLWAGLSRTVTVLSVWFRDVSWS